MGQTFQLADHNPTVTADSLIEPYMVELDGMRARIVGFVDEDPSDVLAAISGVSGRLAEMRAQLQRSNSQRASALRVKEVDPLREELDLQFRVWSRRIAVMEWELRLAGGGT
jgi:hypothetical protein